MGPDTVPYANYNAFRDMYMYRKDQYGYVWAPKPELPSLTAAMLKRTCIFFSKKECLDLPPIVRSKLYCEMSPAQKTMYADLRANLEVILRDIENIKTSINGVEKPSIGMHSDYKLKVSNALTVTGKLHQISSGFVMDTVERLDEDGDLVDDYDVNEIKKIYFFKENPKLDLLMDAIKNELPPDKKAVIWAVNTCAIDMIYDRLSKEKIGGCIKVYKDVNAFQAVESFKTEKYRFMIANPKKAGVGLNMQFSNYQYFYMNGFSYVVRDQAESRQDRKGQTESVNCIDLIAKKSADERIVKVLIEKKEMSDYLNEVCSPDES
jgi:SNF2 family DNA or RNA helicase